MKKNKLNYIFMSAFILLLLKYLDKIMNILPIIGLVCILIFITKKHISNNKYRNSTLDEIDTMTGKEFEKYLAVKYKDMGYKVKQIGGSGDYGADLILTKGAERVIVQAKRYSSHVGVKAVQIVIGAKDYYDGTKAMVVTNNFFTANAKVMANKCNVILIDRNTLKQMIGSFNKEYVA